MNDQPSAKTRDPKGYAILALKGYCMGIADLIPGISGGTIAFLMGIYEELISSIRSFDWNFVKLLLRFRIREAFSAVAWQFLVAVFTGIICAVITLSHFISWLISNKPVLLHAFFFGLILATVPIIIRIIKKWTVLRFLLIIGVAIATYYFVGLVPLATPETLWFLFLSGAIAISAMILPGVSGAFILVLLGKYQYFLDAVNHRDLLSVGVFVLGVIVGILSFVRVLSWLFNKYHDPTVAVIAGIVIGSLRKIWPWKEIVETITTSHGKVIPIKEINICPSAINGEVGLAIGIMVTGFVLALLLNSSSDGKLLS